MHTPIFKHQNSLRTSWIRTSNVEPDTWQTHSTQADGASCITGGQRQRTERTQRLLESRQHTQLSLAKVQKIFAAALKASWMPACRVTQTITKGLIAKGDEGNRQEQDMGYMERGGRLKRADGWLQTHLKVGRDVGCMHLERRP